jgi:hypothetical protein
MEMLAMYAMKRLWAVVPVILAVIGTPAAAQDDDWFDEEPFFALEEGLANLDESLLALDNMPFMWWTQDHCEEGEDCHVEIIVEDGNRIVIVNGDTLKDKSTSFAHPRHFAFKFGPGDHMKGHHPGVNFHRNFSGRLGSRLNPELRRMEREARSLARKIRESEGDEREQLETELDGKLDEIFTFKMQQQDKQIERAEKRVERLKERRAKRESAKDQIIEDRKEELLGRERYLEW